MWLHMWLAVLCCGFLINAESLTSTSFYQEYEWVRYGKLPQYAHDTAFSLLSFNIPPLTHKAEFHVFLNGSVRDNKVLLSLRRAGIPVLQAYNETVPESYILPTDQQSYETKNKPNVTLTLNSPASGRVYLVATELNPLKDVVDFLQWGQKLEGGITINVTANYTLRTSLNSLSVDEVAKISSARGLKQIYSFRVPRFTMSYSVNISDCQHGNSSQNCPVSMMTADSLAADDNSSESVDCRQQGSVCLLNVSSPCLDQDHFITFSIEDLGRNQTTTFDVSFDVQGCVVESVQSRELIEMIGSSELPGNARTAKNPEKRESFSYGPLFSSNSSSRAPIASSDYRNLMGIDLNSGIGAENPVCVNFGYLGRRSYPDEVASFSFNAEFGPWTSGGEIKPHFEVVVPDFSTEVRIFSLQESLDAGGTLYIEAELSSGDWEGVVWVCAMPHRLPLNGSLDQCPHGALLTLNTSANGSSDHQNVSSHAYQPFPTSGSWYLAFQSRCFGAQPCKTLPTARLRVKLEECAPNNCGDYGYCQIYTDANLVFAGCDCFAGYRGLLCNDDTYRLTDGELKRAVYLLTLSNLAFVPAICLALYRRYFILAAIFFFTLFFSSFYHACDTGRVYRLCIMDYNTLSFCDFFGSVLSFYAVLMFMARIPDSCRSFLLLVGALVISVFQTSDRHSDLAHITPLAMAGGLMIISWLLVMRSRRQLFPSRRRYLFFLIPGVVLALTGIGVNYGLMWRKSSYQYTHSFWHFALMVSPCFLMPPRSKKGSKKNLSISAQDIIRGDPQQSESLLNQQESDEPAMFDASMNSINAGQNRLI